MQKKVEWSEARRRQRRSFTPEFKAEVIALVLIPTQPIAQSEGGRSPDPIEAEHWSARGRAAARCSSHR